MIFFVFAAMLNVIIAFFLPTLFGIDAITAESLWVDYKTFGNAILNFVFAVICILYLMKTNPEILAEVKDLKKDNKLTK